MFITDYIESVNGLKSVCPIYVKSLRLSRNNASRDRYTHAQKQCEKGLLLKVYHIIVSIKCILHFFQANSGAPVAQWVKHWPTDLAD